MDFACRYVWNVLIFMFMCGCGHVYTCVWRKRSTSGTLISCSLPYSSKQGPLLNLDRMAGHWTPGIRFLHTSITGETDICLAFIVVLVTQIQVLTLTWQVLYQLRHLPNPQWTFNTLLLINLWPMCDFALSFCHWFFENFVIPYLQITEKVNVFLFYLTKNYLFQNVI